MHICGVLTSSFTLFLWWRSCSAMSYAPHNATTQMNWTSTEGPPFTRMVDHTNAKIKLCI
ncbi:hypothetical protein PF008_g26751 [Phytophthora fragariae]|uniref:Secreted protein n=1 Tax=Phytophthora fragariae TaxID=53985 RepID=A0A6G0QGA7_9STRA|nr:hypothetical protein PF008_g26751 [Phytophthora fragariae]